MGRTAALSNTLLVAAGIHLARATPAEWELQCTPLSDMGEQISFCKDLLLNSSRPVHYVSSFTEPLVQDSLARQTSETVLNMATSCRLIVIGDECVQSYREYACVSNFLFCHNDTDGASLLQPCRSMCFKYCEDCMLDICPCSHLPETDCYTYDTHLDWNATASGAAPCGSFPMVAAVTAAAVGFWQSSRP